MTTMRQRFYELAAQALDDDPRVAIVLAEIGASQLPRHDRVFNVGIREQLMIGVAAGLAFEGLRPIVHSYTPFLVERPYEQVKLDLGHQDVGAILASIGASYDAARRGPHAPVAGRRGAAVRAAGVDHPRAGASRRGRAGCCEARSRSDDRVYIRLSQEANRTPVHADGLAVLRRGSDAAPVVVAVGPTLDETLAATRDLDATVAYLATVRPFDAHGLRELVRGTDVVLVEPYLAGTSAAEVAAALADRPHRLLSLGVPNAELRRYGTGREHRAAHGLDAEGIRRALEAFARSAPSVRPRGSGGRGRRRTRA